MVGKESSQKRLEKYVSTYEKQIVWAILALGVLLRLLRIATREIAYDDAFSFFLASKGFAAIIQGTAADTMPPLYYFLLAGFTTISSELWFLRLLNVILSTATIGLLYLTARALFGKAAGQIAILFAAVSPFMIYHAQELRMYSLLLLGQSGYLYALIRICLSDVHKIKYYLLAVIFGLLALYSHNLGVAGIIACNFVFFLNRSKKNFLALAGIQFTLLLLFLPWAVYLPQQITKVQAAFWTPRPGILELIQSLITLFSFAPMPLWLMGIVLLLLLQNFVLYVLWLTRNPQKSRWTLLAIGLAIPGILFLLSYITIPVFVPRIFILSMLIAFMLMADYVVQNWPKFSGKMALVTFMLVLIVSLPYHYLYESFPRSSFKAAGAYISSHYQPSTAVLHDNKLSYFPMLFHNPDLLQYYLADPQGSANDTLAPASQTALGHIAVQGMENFAYPPELLFVTFIQTEREYQDLGSVYHHLEALRHHYGREISLHSIGDIHLYYFEGAQ